MDLERELIERPLETFEKYKNPKHKSQVIYTSGKEIRVYPSSSQGSNIKNAETGEFSKSIVGSTDEDFFFKVTVATGQFENGPLTLFYNSPAHYENHHGIVLDENTKFNWRLKQQTRESKE